MSRPARVFDTSALLALFAGAAKAFDLLEQADSGTVTVCLPTVCIAEAQEQLHAETGWDPIVLIPYVHSLPLGERAAIEIGLWPGDLGTRHAVHEAQAIGATVVTARPDDYTDLNVPLLVV